MKLVGRAHPAGPSHFSMKSTRQAPTPAKKCSPTKAKETGILVEGRLELVVGLETFVLEAGVATTLKAPSPIVFCQSVRRAGATNQRSHTRELLTTEAPCQRCRGSRSRIPPG